MIMDKLISVVSTLGAQRFEEDVIDRINFQLTAYLFGAASIIISSKLYLGNSIVCWVPAEFRDGWYEYARDYCLIENTYYIPITDPSMPGYGEREKQELPYYQWVQFLLLLLAFFFYFPHLLWRSVNWWSGIQVRAIVTASAALKKKLTIKERDDELKKIVDHIQNSFDSLKRQGRNTGCCSVGSNNWLSFAYIVLKLSFLVNIVLQLIILHIFLGFDWADFFHLRLGFNTDWKSTGLFPRSTMCDFDIRNKGNLQRYSVQCVLSLNMFNEKIFLVLFYWLIILFFMTLINLLVWARDIFFDSARVDFAQRMLSSAGVDPHNGGYEYDDDSTVNEKKSLLKEHRELNHTTSNTYDQFIHLNKDLLVLLRLISSNAGDAVCSDIVAALFKKKKYD